MSKNIAITDKPNLATFNPYPLSGSKVVSVPFIIFKNIYNNEKDPPVKSNKILIILHPLVLFL